MENEELCRRFMFLNQEGLNNEFKEMCFSGSIKEIKYLLTSPDLLHHSNIHSDNDFGFKELITSERMDIINYLIFDRNIEKTKEIEDFIKRFKYEKVENMFKLRELNKKLNEELVSENKNTKKMKL